MNVPWGHSEVAHGLLGFCCFCPNRGNSDELLAWRTWAMQPDLATHPFVREQHTSPTAPATAGCLLITGQTRICGKPQADGIHQQTAISDIH